MHNHLVSLDWLRSIAIIFILLIHIFDDYSQNQLFSIKYVTSLGVEAFVRIGLPLFFVLSGFLLIKPYENGQAIKKFYQRRLQRILPLFLFWSFIYYLYSKQSFDLLDFFRCLVTEPLFYHLWFVYAILGIYIVTPLISNIVVNTKPQAILLYCVISICVYTFEPVFKFFNVNTYFYQFFIQFWFIYFIGGYCI
ncbi:MAG: acyltransferase family protein, partial [Desulfovibrio sp.]|nr:acyltransferase family protein [Desulfovibrio sp.]